MDYKFRFKNDLLVDGLELKLYPLSADSFYWRVIRDDGFELLLLALVIQQYTSFKLKITAYDSDTRLEYTTETRVIDFLHLMSSRLRSETLSDVLERMVAFEMDRCVCGIFGHVEYGIARGNFYGRLL